MMKLAGVRAHLALALLCASLARTRSSFLGSPPGRGLSEVAPQVLAPPIADPGVCECSEAPAAHTGGTCQVSRVVIREDHGGNKGGLALADLSAIYGGSVLSDPQR